MCVLPTALKVMLFLSLLFLFSLSIAVGCGINRARHLSLFGGGGEHRDTAGLDAGTETEKNETRYVGQVLCLDFFFPTNQRTACHFVRICQLAAGTEFIEKSGIDRSLCELRCYTECVRVIEPTTSYLFSPRLCLWWNKVDMHDSSRACMYVLSPKFLS